MIVNTRTSFLRLCALTAIGMLGTACPKQQAEPTAASKTKPGAKTAVELAPVIAAAPVESGTDYKKLLGNIAEGLSKPGPYEAPRASAADADKAAHVAVLTLDGVIVERTGYSLRGGSGIELRELTDKLDAWSKDAKITGLLLRFEPLTISIPDAVELRTAMMAFRKSGKKIDCHTEGASNATYLVMTACDRIGLSPLGEIIISGPSAMPIHLKPLLDKFGVTADFLHVGAFKGAAEPLTRDAPSPEALETLNAILDRRYATTVEMIAQSRNIAPTAVKAIIDAAMMLAPDALANKLVDQVATFEQFRDAVIPPPAAWAVEKLHDEPSPVEAMMKLAQFVGAVPAPRPSDAHVALVYAIGNIVDGDGKGLLGARQEIASRTLTAALHALAVDDNVKAVVLRIDSGGGSALASELIWHAVTELKAKKPVIVSMSDVAASGGYYIASGATKIYALPDTLTGSIGVVGGKLAIGDALDKFGIKQYPMGRGKRATMFTSLTPWTPYERAAVQHSMDSTYETFVARVVAGRGKPAEAIKLIAQGRVWTGEAALANGLVDAMGGLDAALTDARQLGKVAPDSALEVYPPMPTLRDIFTSIQGTSIGALGTSAIDDAISTSIRGLSPAVAGQVSHLWELATTFATTPVQTLAILPPLWE